MQTSAQDSGYTSGTSAYTSGYTTPSHSTLHPCMVTEFQSLKDGIRELERDFEDLRDAVADYLERAQVDPSKLKRCIIQLPASMRQHHIKFLTTELSAIKAARTIDEIFSILDPYWDFLNCGLLERIVDRLGDQETKSLMGKYSEKLRKFRMRTKVGDLVGMQLTPANSSEFVTTMGEEWLDQTLEDVERFRIGLSLQFGLEEYVMPLKKAKTG